jgi:ferredoxin
MTVNTVRKIVKIDEEKCNGCSACVPQCAEGALQIIDGKARLVSEVYCDGLGACLGECPMGAITIEERVAEDFNEEAVERHLHEKEPEEETLACGCASAQVQELDGHIADLQGQPVHQPSTLRHWPVQLTLVPVRAPFLQGADVLLAAHCVAFAYGGFHQDFLKDHTLLIACPKLDDIEAHLDKLTQLVSHSGLKSLTVLHMEVPCCSGLVYLAKKAIEASGRKIPLKEITISINGDIKE